MPYKSCKEYLLADIIIDCTCEVGEITYFDLIFARKSKKINTLRGVVCLLAWEYGIHARRMAKLIRRTRGNILNQQRTYRHFLQSKDKLTTEYYTKIKDRIKIKIEDGKV